MINPFFIHQIDGAEMKTAAGNGIFLGFLLVIVNFSAILIDIHHEIAKIQRVSDSI